MSSIMFEGRKTIKDHEGVKYLRKIRSPVTGETIEVDVYAVLTAFGVPCHATGHAIKKLLCAGDRGKGSRIQDLQGAMAALNRAMDEAIACGLERALPLMGIPDRGAFPGSSFEVPPPKILTPQPGLKPEPDEGQGVPPPKPQGFWEVLPHLEADMLRGYKVVWSIRSKEGEYLTSIVYTIIGSEYGTCQGIDVNICKRFALEKADSLNKQKVLPS